MAKMTLKDCCEMFAAFFKIGAVTFGGGYSMLPILEHELDKKRGWVTKEELLDYFAMGQTIPGIIAVNVASFIGSKRGGLLGSILAVLGVICPSIIVISLIAAFISNFADNPAVKKVLFGMNLGVAATLVDSVWSMLRKSVVDPVTAILAAVTFVSAAFFGVHSVMLLAVGVACGLILKWRPRKHTGQDGDSK